MLEAIPKARINNGGWEFLIWAVAIFTFCFIIMGLSYTAVIVGAILSFAYYQYHQFSVLFFDDHLVYKHRFKKEISIPYRNIITARFFSKIGSGITVTITYRDNDTPRKLMFGKEQEEGSAYEVLTLSGVTMVADSSL